MKATLGPPARRMYPQVFGKYVIERELARGGMARVVLATLRGAGGFEKKLVVKQVRDELACDDEFVRRFVEEAKTTVALAHPNIVPVYELGVELGTYFLAMEFVEGLSLAELLRALGPAPGGSSAEGRLSPEEAAYVGVEVCRALDYAHRRMNVVHRDVTPRNVMVDEEGHVRVIDFGIAAPVATTERGDGVFGSPGHMPPEQMAGAELSPATDVFAVAVLLMELWSGRPPFRRRTNDEIDAALRAPHPKPSDADIRLLPLDEAFQAAMALDPKRRPQQADDLGRVLRRFLAGIDLGDVAHSLGDRVRAVRARPERPVAEARQILQRPPSRPTGMQVGTATFASRDEVRVVEEARKRESAGPSTRRLASAAPPREPIAEEVLTQPIETNPPGKMRPPASRLWWGLAVAGGVLAAAGFSWGRGAASGAPPSPMATTPATAPLPLPTVAATPALASARAAAPVVVPPPAALDPDSEAHLTLLGDGTTVSVDGVPRGPCPTHVAVEPGLHTVVFSFAATGESKAEPLTVRARSEERRVG